MSITPRSVSYGQAASTTVSIAKPGTVVTGDLMIAFLSWGRNSSLADVPSGWTPAVQSSIGFGGYEGQYAWVTRRVDGTEGAGPFAFTFNAGDTFTTEATGAIVCFGGNTPTIDTYQLTNGGDGQVASLALNGLTPGHDGIVVAFVGNTNFDPGNATAPAGFTEDADSSGSGSLTGPGGVSVHQKACTAGVATGTVTPTWANITYRGGYQISLYEANLAPNAPTLNSPIGAATINRTVDNIFDWDFSDDDAGDTQSAYEFRRRVVGDISWTTTGKVPSTASQRTVVGGNLAAADWEWQVRTYDAAGLVGPFSSSAFFTAADPPAAPTILHPANEATIPGSDDRVDWSFPSETDYQVRKVADLAGVADTGTIYFDTGDVVSTALRTQALTFPINARYEHIQVRVKSSGIWSPYASVRVRVSYLPPAIPTVAVTVHQVDGLDAALQVAVTNP